MSIDWAYEYPLQQIGKYEESASWEVRFQNPIDHRYIQWTDLLDIAENYWSHIRRHYGENAVTQGGHFLVAVLFVPDTAGGQCFVSTIPRTIKQDNMRTYGRDSAPVWWRAANTGVEAGKELTLHAEDAVIFNFERAVSFNRDRHRENPSLRERLLLPYVRITPRGYRMESRDNPLGRLRLAVWGYFEDSPERVKRTGQPIELCSGDTKKPSCQVVAERLKISYCTPESLREEGSPISFPRSSGPPPSSSSHPQPGPSRPPPSSSSHPQPGPGGGDSRSRGPISQVSGSMSGLRVSSSSTPSRLRPQDPRSR
ncbi:hypothetical protein B0J18DRAFT_419769 [Chaetomium sp. MPI-SDFR-AT-0129]|nr:hypothetical protein B0J18DRAFT_419769 [Chaetomium sp. MPI-SDFR-AT-0129]